MSRRPKGMPLPPLNQAEVADNPEAADQPVAELDGGLELDAAFEDMPVEKPAPVAVAKRKIKVVALRAGFIHQHRKVQGDKFEMTPDELKGAHWVKCEDPHEQKKHEEALRKARLHVNRAAIEADELDKHKADE